MMLYAFIVYSHLSGTPEDYQIMSLNDRMLACQDERENFPNITERAA
jgi:hypothetical protein